MTNLSTAKRVSSVLIFGICIIGIGVSLPGHAFPVCVDPVGGTCLCQADVCVEGCKCENCTGGSPNCACVAQLQSQTGSVTGVVKDKLVKRYSTLVYIDRIDGHDFPPPAKHPVMDQNGKKFVPHVLPVLVGATVDFLNSDSFAHNVFSPDGERYDLGSWSKGRVKEYIYKKLGVYTQLCKIHPEMVAYVIVLQNPFHAITEKDGSFTIPHVPPGTWKIKAWNERMKPAKANRTFDVTVQQGQETTVTIPR